MKRSSFKLLSAVITLWLLASLAVPLATAEKGAINSAQQCQFVLGFKALHDMIPNIVGDCVTNVQNNPQNGDGLQITTKGMLVWRKLTNTTAFTDGNRTWVLGPFGLQTRLNTELLPWEKEINDAIQKVRDLGYEVSNAATYNPGAVLHVLIGVQVPTADAHRQNAFFFVNQQYIGTDTIDPSADIWVDKQTTDTVTLEYVLYRPEEPMCCPTGGEALVRYHWDGTRLFPQDPIPSSDWNAPLSRR